MSTPKLSEANNSRQWQNGQMVTEWIITGTSDDGMVRMLLDALPADLYDAVTGDTLTRAEQTDDAHAVWVDETADEGQWTARVRYQRSDEPRKSQRPTRIGDVRITGHIGGASQHILVSKATAHAYGSGAHSTTVSVGDFGGGADKGGLMDVGPNGVEGCETDATVMLFQVTKTFAGNALPSLGTLWNLRGKTNDASFTVTDSVTGISITMNAGEGRLLNVSFGEGRADGGIPFTFELGNSPNRTGLKVGTITGIACEGWQHMWTKYEDTPNDNLKCKVSIPFAVYVEKVFDSGPFSDLGL